MNGYEVKIVSFEPFLTELVAHFGRTEHLVGVSDLCDAPPEAQAIPKVTSANPNKSPLRALSERGIIENTFLSLAPDLVLCSIRGIASRDGQPSDLLNIEAALSKKFGKEVRVRSFFAPTVERVFSMFEEVGEALGTADKGRTLAGRAKAQLMDWGTNFYERMRSKKVTILSSVEPLTLAGYWVNDITRFMGCVPHYIEGKEGNVKISWQDIAVFNPDVLLVAPQGLSVKDAMKTFLKLEKLKEWSGLLAVKRGEVFFSRGDDYFYRPGPRILETASIVISAIAGLESGYISEKDSFFRLRYLEMFRHKL